jgi:hypothetical protein
MDNQLNELKKGDRANDKPNRYNLRSKNKRGKADVPEQPTRDENPANDVASSSVGIGADPGFNAQENNNKSLTTDPFGNT